eukprot:495490-Hanusia_phi.AAC.1
MLLELTWRAVFNEEHLPLEDGGMTAREQASCEGGDGSVMRRWTERSRRCRRSRLGGREARGGDGG